jgi:chromosome segregation ATPase
MKKIAVALGLIQAATEAQILEAVAAKQSEMETLKNELASCKASLQEATDYIAATKDHAKQHIDTIASLQDENKTLQEHNGEMIERIKELTIKEANESELSDDDALNLAANTLESAGLELGFPVSDGQVFTTEDDAKRYAEQRGLKVLSTIKL